MWASVFATRCQCSRKVVRLKQCDRQLFQLPNIFGNPTGQKRKEYVEKRLIGYSMEQMFDTAADIDNYKDFVPWCTESRVTSRRDQHCVALLGIGFPPIVERYTSNVVLQRPTLVKSIAVSEGRLFNHMLNLWELSPGLPGNPHTCYLRFTVSFEFRSALHSRIAYLFFDDIVKRMINAFLGRAQHLYGPPAVPHSKPTVIKYVP